MQLLQHVDAIRESKNLLQASTPVLSVGASSGQRFSCDGPGPGPGPDPGVRVRESGFESPGPGLVDSGNPEPEIAEALFVAYDSA